MWEKSTLVCQIVFGEIQTDEIDIRFIYLEKYQMLKMFSTAKKERIDTFFLCSSNGFLKSPEYRPAEAMFQ